MYISKRHIPRRTVLRGLGATLALPLLDAMVPAATAMQKTAAAGKPRLAAIEMVHGAAGCSVEGLAKNLWSPAKDGSDFEFSPSLSPLEPFRDYVTIISDTDLANAEALTAAERGGDHNRSSAVFLTGSHPKQTEGSEFSRAHRSTRFMRRSSARIRRCRRSSCVSRMWARSPGRAGMAIAACIRTRFPGRLRRCPFRWSGIRVPCSRASSVRARRLLSAQRAAARGSASWTAFATECGCSSGISAPRIARGSIGIWMASGKSSGGSSTSSAAIARIRADELPDAPIGVPDSFEEHTKLMFDLQVLAFATEVTRVSAFKMGRDVSPRVYPESGVTTPFHSLSHHSDRSREDRGVRETQSPTTSRSSPTSSRNCAARPTATATSSTIRWSSTAVRWPTAIFTRTVVCRCFLRATPTGN